MIRVFIRLLLVLAMIIWPMGAYSVSALVQPQAAARPGGIAGLFLKPRELMAGDHWNSRPLKPELAAANLARYDAIWCAQSAAIYNPAAFEYLHRGKRAGMLLFYFSGLTARKNGTEAYLDYDYINERHPEWFLLGENGSADLQRYRNPDGRIRWKPDDPGHVFYNRFFLDVGNRDFQLWAVEEILKKLAGSGDGTSSGYDGLAMDNVLLTVGYTGVTQKYPGWKYAGSMRSWTDAYFDYIKTVHDALSSRGLVLIVNHTTDYGSNEYAGEWNTLMSIVDGMMDENALGPPTQTVWDGERWLCSIGHHEEILRKGLYDWWVCKPAGAGQKAREQFMYVYCSFLLVNRPGLSLFHAMQSTDSADQGAAAWYEEYNLPIGAPEGPRYARSDCWLRDYENCKVIVNPGPASQAFAIDSERYWLDWAKQQKVSTVQLAPRSATILLPTAYRIETTGGTEAAPASD